MDMFKAQGISEILGGELYEREDGTWAVIISRADGRIVAVLNDTVEEYADLDALEAGRCYACISLA